MLQYVYNKKRIGSCEGIDRGSPESVLERMSIKYSGRNLEGVEYSRPNMLKH